MYDLLIRNAQVIDGSGQPAWPGEVAVCEGRIVALGKPGTLTGPAREQLDADGLVLSPGFIDVHTHDDLDVIRSPNMLSKLSQGVTTVIVGNCGISASPVQLRGAAPDPMNLLGDSEEFRYPRFADYRRAVEVAAPAVNVAALVGHTALRNNHLDHLDRDATDTEISAMRAQLRDSLECGALGLSTGLAYASANSASAREVELLSTELTTGGVYTTHLRDEFAQILPALEEAYAVGRHSGAAVRVSHLKCAGIDNWQRSAEVLTSLENASLGHDVACDCYPYAASASTLDLKQVTDAYDILITWSHTHPQQAGRTLAEIAGDWSLSLLETAHRLQPAGAVYFCMDEADVRRILQHPLTMIGSDGLPCDPRPHPRLWGTFPRVLGHYARDQGLFPLHEAVRKMTGFPADRFALHGRGRIKQGAWADLVLFDPARIRDNANYHDPIRAASGIHAVWVNGQLAYDGQSVTSRRAGRFLAPAAHAPFSPQQDISP